MNKSEVVKKIAESTDLSEQQVRSVMDTFSDIVFQKCKNGEVVQIYGFGTFRKRTFGSHKFTNFQEASLCEERLAPASATIHFSCSKTFKSQFQDMQLNGKNVTV